MGQLPTSQLDFLRKSLERDAAMFDARRKNNRRKAFLLMTAVTLSSGLTTVLLGLKGSDIFGKMEPYLSAIALVTSAFVTLFSAWDAFFDHRWLWVRYTTTQASLQAVRDDLEYAAASGHEISQDELDRLHKRRQEVLGENGAAWSQKRGTSQGKAGEGSR